MARTRQSGTNQKQQAGSRWGSLNAVFGGGRRTRISPPFAIGAIVVLTAAAVLASGRNNAQNLPAAAKASAAKQAARAKAEAPTIADADSTQLTAPTGQRDIQRYTGHVRDTMFSEPQPPTPKPAPAPRPRTAFKQAPQRELAPAPINPFAEWSYTGSATVEDTVVAIVENTHTRDSQLLHVGDSFIGAQVTGISNQMLTLKSAGRPVMLAMSQNINVTPMDRSAPYLTNQANPQGQNGPQNVPIQVGLLDRRKFQSMTPDSSGDKLTLPNGTMLTGKKATRYRMKLNGNFNN